MARSQLELVRHLEALDASAPRVERHLWLIGLLDWVRGSADWQNPSEDEVQAVLTRVRSLLDAVAVRPHWRQRWRRWWAVFITTTDETPLLADLGFAPRAAFLSELTRRLRKKLLPVTPDSTNQADLIYLLFPGELDARWLRALDKETARRMGELLFDEEPPGPGSAAQYDYAERALLDALTYAVSQISAIGLSPGIRSRMSMEARQARRFHDLPAMFEALRTAVQTQGRLSPGAQQAIAAFREHLDACRASANTVYAHLQEHGISVNIEFQIQQMRQRILRVKGLLLCLETAEPVLAAAQMLSHLVRVSRDTLSVRALIRSNTQLLAAKVTERNAEGGEHYITRNGKEYRQMLRAAAGGGAVMALATWGKLFLYTLGLSAFWGGLAAGINYSLAFVLVMLLHWTIATKQPAMTAPALAAKLRSLNAPGAIDGFVTEVMFLLRSQFAAIAGNLVLVIPLAWLLGLAFAALGDTRMMTAPHARHVIADHHLFGPTPLFAAITGVLLFASSVVAGWVENWFVFHKLDSAIAYNPRSTRWLGKERARRWGCYWREHISGYAANISLGLMLGLAPPVLQFFGIHFEVRHVTLVAGQMAAAAHQLGPAVLHESAFWWAVAGALLTGLMNVAFSFHFAFRLALTAHNISNVERHRIYRAVWRRMWRHPLGFILPRKSDARLVAEMETAAAADGENAAPDSPASPKEPPARQD